MTSRVTLTPPTFLRRWDNELFERLGDGPFLLQGYTVATLPDASLWASTLAGNEFSSLIFVADALGGPNLAFTDGNNWRLVTDRTVVM